MSKAESKSREEIIPKRITGWRVWFFRLVALTIIPVLLLGLLEVGLRIVGYGFPTNAFIKCEVNGTASYCNNAKFAWRFFHPTVAKKAGSFVFPAHKSNDTYRIFVMGASAAAGTPDGAYCFGRFLQVMLRRRYPQVNFEVINTAMPTINSHVVLNVAKDSTRHQGDLFIVYLGNNEVVGPYGAGTVFTPLSSSLSLIRLGIALKATKLSQLIMNLMETTGLRDDSKVWHGMKTFLEKQVRADEPGLKIVYSHFEKNLQDIRRVVHRSGAKIIFSTVPSNLKDNPPFASLHRPNLTDADLKKWNELYQRGLKFEEAGSYTESAEQYLSAAEIDENYADLQYRLGRCYWVIGEYDKARERYRKAGDLDTLKFRSDTRINEVIRSVAGGRSADGVYLVDAVRVFEENSPHRIPGEELFYEHIHMNFRGDYLIAGAIFRQVEKILPEWIERYKKDEQPLCTEAECARYLAYTAWDKYKITQEVLNVIIKQPPFTNQIYHNRQVGQMEQKLLKDFEDFRSPGALDEIQAQYRWAIQQAPSDWRLYWNYGRFLEYLQDYNSAGEQYRLVLNFVPHRYRAHSKLAFISGMRGNSDEAINYSLKAIQINPVYAEAYYNLGVAYHKQGRFDEAVKCYYKMIRLTPYLAQPYKNLAIALYQQGKISEALETYRSGLKLVPDDLDLHYNLAMILEKQGHRNKAIKELRSALEIDPNSVKTRKALEAILSRK